MFARAYAIIDNIRLGAISGPFTDNPALLWSDAQDAGGAARVAEVARAFDVHSLEHEPVERAKQP
ncbi:MAG TPA: hypothetical protein VK932_24925 [Kofleriaceae bacterium]|nr:hypothetical protein [Kofleriaceae bacterium]